MKAHSQDPTRHDAIQRESRATAAAWAGFGTGLLLGVIALAGPARPIAGEGSVAQAAAGVAAVVTASAFVLSTLLHRRGETATMPRWQRVISHTSTIALTVVFGAVAFVGVLTGGEILAQGLVGLEAPWFAGALLLALPCAMGGWLAFQAGVELRTRDLATLLFTYLTIGTVFSMLTATDPRWWERHFSELGSDWAFNVTVIVAGLLIATIGAYVGRDLHRWLGDARLRSIGTIVALFAATGAALAGVGIFTVADARFIHNLAAFGTLGLFGITAIAVTIVMPGPPRAMLATTLGSGLALVVALLLWQPAGMYSAAALEAIAVGVMFVWMTTLVRTLAAAAPAASRPSARPSLVHAGVDTAQ